MYGWVVGSTSGFTRNDTGAVRAEAAGDRVEHLELRRRFDVEAQDAGVRAPPPSPPRSCRRRRRPPSPDRRRRRARARARRRRRCRSRCPGARTDRARRGSSSPSSRSRRGAACRRTRRRTRARRSRARRASRRSRACRSARRSPASGTPSACSSPSTRWNGAHWAPSCCALRYSRLGRPGALMAASAGSRRRVGGAVRGAVGRALAQRRRRQPQRTLDAAAAQREQDAACTRARARAAQRRGRRSVASANEREMARRFHVTSGQNPNMPDAARPSRRSGRTTDSDDHRQRIHPRRRPRRSPRSAARSMRALDDRRRRRRLEPQRRHPRDRMRRRQQADRQPARAEPRDLGGGARRRISLQAGGRRLARHALRRRARRRARARCCARRPASRSRSPALVAQRAG